MDEESRRKYRLPEAEKKRQEEQMKTRFENYLGKPRTPPRETGEQSKHWWIDDYRAGNHSDYPKGPDARQKTTNRGNAPHNLDVGRTLWLLLWGCTILYVAVKLVKLLTR